jgi:hypothetical protein
MQISHCAAAATYGRYFVGVFVVIALDSSAPSFQLCFSNQRKVLVANLHIGFNSEDVKCGPLAPTMLRQPKMMMKKSPVH